MTKAASTMQSSQQHTTQGVSMAAKILNVDEAKLVRAAGGIIRRNGTRGPMGGGIVPPPGYDDWAFPQSKNGHGGWLGGTRRAGGGEENGLRWKLGAPLGR